LYENFFSHFEAEEKILDHDGRYRWIKKPNLQNHLFDCRLYAMIAKNIMVEWVGKSGVLGVKNPSWGDYVVWAKSKIK
jgi:phage terminase large subunit GpA-like protein